MAALLLGTLALLLIGSMSIVAAMWMSPEGLRLRETVHVVETSMASQRSELQGYLASMQGRWPSSTELLGYMATNAQAGLSRVASAPEGYQWMISGTPLAITFCLMKKTHPDLAQPGDTSWTDEDGSRVNKLAKRITSARNGENVEIAATCAGTAAACPGADPFCSETSPRVIRHVLARP